MDPSWVHVLSSLTVLLAIGGAIWKFGRSNGQVEESLKDVHKDVKDLTENVKELKSDLTTQVERVVEEQGYMRERVASLETAVKLNGKGRPRALRPVK